MWNSLGNSMSAHCIDNPCCIESLESRLLMDAAAVLDGAAARSLSFIEDDGTAVMVMLRGAQAEITIVGDITSMNTAGGKVNVSGTGLSIGAIDILESTARGSLTINARGGGDGLATVGEVRGSSPLRSLAARTTDLTGAGIVLTGEGTITRLQLHDVLNGADIQLPGAGDGRGVSIQARLLSADTDVIVGQGLKSLQLYGWESGQLVATQARSINVKSSTAAGLDGDLGAAVTLTGAGVAANKLTLTTCRIAGTLGGQMTVTGSVGNFRAGHLAADVDISGSARSFRVGDALTILPSPIDPSNRIQIGGRARVFGGRERFAAANVNLYTASEEQVYDLVGLDGFKGESDWWEYDLRMSTRVPGEVFGENLQMRIYEDAYDVDGDSLTVWAHAEAYNPDTDQWDSDESLDVWIVGEDGVHDTRLSGGIAGEFTQLNMDLVTSPRLLAIGDEVDASQYLSNCKYSFAEELLLSLNGNVSTTTTVFGHETVSVPAGEFLTVKYGNSTTFVGYGTTQMEGHTLGVRLTLVSEEVDWADGVHGILKSALNTKFILTLSYNGQSHTTKITDSLAAWLTDSSTL